GRCTREPLESGGGRDLRVTELRHASARCGAGASRAIRRERPVNSAGRRTSAPGLHDERRNHALLTMTRDRTDVVVTPGRDPADIDLDVAGLPSAEEDGLCPARDERPGIGPRNLESMRVGSR